MAIQFNCPYCTASIRVPDTAAGKRGTCPKCATQLIVPNVAPPTSGAPPVPKAQPVPKEPLGAAIPEPKPGPPPLPDPAPLGFPEIQTELPLIAEAPPMAQVVRRRAKRKGTNPLIPITLFSVVLGLLGYWMLKPGVTIEGELSAEKVPGFPVPPAAINKSVFRLPDEEGESAWEELIKHPPSSIRIPERFQMQFEPTENELKVAIKPEPSAEVFRVRTNAALRQFVNLHADDITRQRQKEFEEAARNFITDWQTSKQNDLPFQTDSYYETVGFNRLTGVLGYSVAAEVGDRTYRCVHEDPEGHLYFFLPAQTEQFVLQGRKLPDGKMLFESRLTVNISETPAPEPPAKTTEPETMPEPSTEPMGEPMKD